MYRYAEVRATGHSWGNLLARVGALLTTYWGGINMPEAVKVWSYVFTALLGLGLAIVLPEGVMLMDGTLAGEGDGKGAGAGAGGGGGVDGDEDTKPSSGKSEGYGAVSGSS